MRWNITSRLQLRKVHITNQARKISNMESTLQETEFISDGMLAWIDNLEGQIRLAARL